MNFLQIARRVKQESGRSGTIASVSGAIGDDALIVNWSIDAWREIQRMPRKWAWMRRTATPTLAVQMEHAKTVFDLSRFGVFLPETDEYWPTAYDPANPATEWRIRWLPYEEFRRRFVVGTHAAGPIQYWAVSPTGTMLVGPTPDIAYVVRIDYLTSTQVFSADADVPEMPEEFHMAIVWRALMSCAASDAANEVYARARGEYDAIESDLIFDQAERITINARTLA